MALDAISYLCVSSDFTKEQLAVSFFRKLRNASSWLLEAFAR